MLAVITTSVKFHVKYLSAKFFGPYELFITNYSMLPPLGGGGGALVCEFAFRSSEVRRLLLDLDTYGAPTHWVCVLFFKRTSDVLPSHLSVIFQWLVHLCSFRAAGDRPISPLFRRVHCPYLIVNVFERLVSVRLDRFVEFSGVLPTTQFAYQKGLGTGDAPLCVSLTLQCALESGQEARIVQINFSAAFHSVIDHRKFYMLSQPTTFIKEISN